MTTIRALMLAQQERHRNIVNGIGVECGCAEGCASPWPCVERVAADAVIARLDAVQHRYRCGPGCWDCDIRNEPWRSTDVRVALVPDPEVS